MTSVKDTEHVSAHSIMVSSLMLPLLACCCSFLKEAYPSPSSSSSSSTSSLDTACSFRVTTPGRMTLWEGLIPESPGWKGGATVKRTETPRPPLGSMLSPVYRGESEGTYTRGLEVT